MSTRTQTTHIHRDKENTVTLMNTTVEVGDKQTRDGVIFISRNQPPTLRAKQPPIRTKPLPSWFKKDLFLKGCAYTTGPLWMTLLILHLTYRHDLYSEVNVYKYLSIQKAWPTTYYTATRLLLIAAFLLAFIIAFVDRRI